jgi:hypothetical protein
MAKAREMSELYAETERIYLDFLPTDLALCFTFANLLRIELEMGDWDAVRRLLTKAEKAQFDITRFLATVVDADRRNEVTQKLNELRAALDSVRHRLAW